MSNSQAPSDSPTAVTDHLLLFFAAIISVGICFTVVGILPIAIIVFGLILSLRSGEIAGVRITTRLIQILALGGLFYCALGLITAQIQTTELMANAPSDPDTMPKFAAPEAIDFRAMAANTEADQIRRQEYSDSSIEYNDFVSAIDEIKVIKISFVTAVFALVFLSAFLQFLWLGPISRQLPNLRKFRLSSRNAPSKPFPTLMASKPISSFSVADELKKWSNLRDEGVITEQEFADARAELLKQK